MFYQETRGDQNSEDDTLLMLQDWLIANARLESCDFFGLSKCRLNQNELREIRNSEEIPALRMVKYLQQEGLLSIVYSRINPYNSANSKDMLNYVFGEKRWFDRATELIFHDYRVKHKISEVPKEIERNIEDKVKSHPLLHRRWRVFYALYHVALDKDLDYAHAPEEILRRRGLVAA
jgi:hypothetical protein